MLREPKFKDKVQLKLSCSRKLQRMTTYFENLTIELYILYVFKTHVKFYVIRLMLFNIRSINLFLCLILYYKSSKFKHLIDNIAIYFFIFLKVCNGNPMADLSKFTSNKKILSGVIVLIYNQVCC